MSEVLLDLKFNSAGIQDLSGHTWTNTGVTFSENGVYGGKSAYFSNNATLYCPMSPVTLDGDFTFKFSLKCNSNFYTSPYAATMIGGSGGGINRVIINGHSSYPKAFYIVFGGSNDQNYVRTLPNSLKTDNEWHEYVITRKDGVVRVFIDGEQYIEQINKSIFVIAESGKLVLGNSFSDGSKDGYVGYLDDVVIIKDEAVYIKPYTPSDTYLTDSRKWLARVANSSAPNTLGYYSNKTGAWVQLPSSENDEELVDLLKAYGTFVCPTQKQLELIGKGAERPKRCCWQRNAKSIIPTVLLSAVPKDQLFLPKKLIDIDGLEGIDNAAIIKAVSSKGDIKFIITTDLITYKSFDFTSGVWETIDHTNLTAVKAGGIDSASLSTVTRAQWDLLTAGNTGIGFAFLLSQTTSRDSCSIDSLSVQVDMKGSWDKAIHGTDYTYGYPKNNMLRVKLLTNGDYKINYSEGEPKIK